jgi:hypothetical protein
MQLLFLFSCVAPEQPALNEVESKMIKDLEIKYSCKAKRNIDAALLNPSKDFNETGSYSLNLLLECSNLLNLHRDSTKIKSESFFIAKNIYNNVLKKDIKYSKVWVSFSCDTSSSMYKDLVFAYNIDTLN